MAPKNATRIGKGKRTESVQATVQRALIKFERKTRELKYVNPIINGTYATTGLVFPITASILQGDTAQQRDGSSVNLYELDINWLSVGTSVGSTALNIRLVIFADTQNTGSLPTITQLLMTAAPGSPFERFVFITKRFRVLYDHAIPLGSLVAGYPAACERRKLMMNNHHVEYLASTGAATDNGAGALFGLIIGDSNVGTYSVNLAVKYYDS